MKHLNIAFTAEQYDRLREVKADRTWRRAILEEFGVIDNE